MIPQHCSFCVCMYAFVCVTKLPVSSIGNTDKSSFPLAISKKKKMKIIIKFGNNLCNLLNLLIQLPLVSSKVPPIAQFEVPPPDEWNGKLSLPSCIGQRKPSFNHWINGRGNNELQCIMLLVLKTLLYGEWTLLFNGLYFLLYEEEIRNCNA